jgi:hypothetical protein
MTFEGLPFFDNLFDNYTVLVSADGYQQAGYVPVKLSNQMPAFMTAASSTRAGIVC